MKETELTVKALISYQRDMSDMVEKGQQVLAILVSSGHLHLKVLAPKIGYGEGTYIWTVPQLIETKATRTMVILFVVLKTKIEKSRYLF